MKIKIDTNVYMIPERLKEIDNGYFVMRDLDNMRFEVHNSNNLSDTFCFVVPFDELDDRTIEHCKKTSIANLDRIIKEMDDYNTKLEMTVNNKAFEEANDKAKEIVKYVKDKEDIDWVENAFSNKMIWGD